MNEQWWERWTKHDLFLETERTVQKTAAILRVQLEEQARAEAVRLQQEEQARRRRTCAHCGREFVNASAMQNHVRDIHQTYTCEVCGRSCKSRNALYQHINATGHW